MSGGAALAGGAAPLQHLLLVFRLLLSAVLQLSDRRFLVQVKPRWKREKTGEVNEELALGTGAIIGLLDRFGAGKVFSKAS